MCTPKGGQTNLNKWHWVVTMEVRRWPNGVGVLFAHPIPAMVPLQKCVESAYGCLQVGHQPIHPSLDAKLESCPT